jgi:hypothetical protein
MAQDMQLIFNHNARTTMSNECRSFFTGKKPINIHCGGIEGTGNRKDAGTWRNSRVLIYQITGNYFTRVLSEQMQRTQAKLNGAFINVQHPSENLPRL